MEEDRLFSENRIALMTLRLLANPGIMDSVAFALLVHAEACVDPGVKAAIRAWADTLGEEDKQDILLVLETHAFAEKEVKRQNSQWN